MFEAILLPKTKDLLKKLNPKSLPQGAYLAGGTAVALHLGHRRSQDLDFFTKENFVEDQWQQKLEEDFGLRLMNKEWQTITGVIDGVKLSLFGYKYPQIQKSHNLHKIKVASLPDLSAMKLDTLTRRGAKRDFIDLYFLAQKFSLPKLFEFYDQKYGNLKERSIMLEKALIFFDEADRDEMPDMLTNVAWEEVKTWLTSKILNKSN